MLIALPGKLVTTPMGSRRKRGQFTLVHNGTCLKCDSCGSTADLGR